KITPSLESLKVLILGIRAAFLVSRCPSTAVESNSHNCLKIITKFHRHLYYRRSSFDLRMNYNRF
ncbi:hypothetical protein B296_00008623, partial [Ensete ventricosum]